MNKKNFLVKNKYRLLLLSILFVILIPSFFSDPYFSVINNITLTVFFLACLNFIRYRQKAIWFSILATTIIITSHWLRFFSYNSLFLKHDMVLLHAVFGISFLLFIGYHLLVSIYRSSKMSIDVIYAAIIGYIFMGMMGSNIYELIELFRPGSYSIQSGNFNDTTVTLYYSFVTISTLGYGDIIPITKLARSFAILFTVSGQAYMTILVAIIVGKYLRVSERRAINIIKSEDESDPN